ncbi:hypothetical protein [Winogradskyella sp. A3E31]|uniref:hypothetical protein n=1 Tax=Winogradskyella sp. A3E31 TaxID=3349637 RepID=UPI00398A953B
MEKHDKKIEELVNKLMTDDSLEQAPNDFTDNVMSKIEALSASKAIVYKPLIPKYLWWLIGAGFLGLVSYVLFQDSGNTASLSERYNLPDVALNPFEGFSFDFSNTFMYVFVLLAIMLSIQIPLLKQYFNNRMSF